MAFRWYDALDEICVGIKDPDHELWEEAKPHFLRALALPLKGEDYTLEDVFGLHKAQAITWSSDTYSIASLKVEKVLSIYWNMQATTYKSVQLMSVEEAGKTNSTLATTKPGADELFVWKIGGSLYARTATGADLGAGSLMEYLEYPDDTSWDDNATTGTDLTTIFTIPYMKQAILLAIQSLTAEDNDFKG